MTHNISADDIMGSNVTTNASLNADVSMERILYNVRAVRRLTLILQRNKQIRTSREGHRHLHRLLTTVKKSASANLTK